uniref:LOB domain-containing protein n=1 Tax=Leersia perrieri TaxID=77586 RepID=A0A0D9X7N5_9ORYZ
MTSTTTINNPITTATPPPHHQRQQQQTHLPAAVAAARPPHSTGSGSSGSHRGGGGGGSGSGSTNQACAACKYQRRKCNPDCRMAPYFPADQQRRFLNAHRLFGVSNILKTLRHLKPELCDDAMRTLIYQAEMRAHDPVLGCCRVIVDLERQLEIETAELNAVLHHLALCRQAAAAAGGGGASASVVAAALPPGILDDPCADLDVTSSNQPLLISAEQEVVDALYANQDADAAILQGDNHQNQEQSQHEQHHGQQQLYDYFYYDSTVGDDVSSKPNLDINVDNMQHFDFDTSYDAENKVKLTSDHIPVGVDEHSQIDSKEFETKATPSLVDVFDMRHEQVDVNTDIVEVKEMVDMNADIEIKTMVDMNVNIVDVVKTMVDVNADIDDVKTVVDVNGDIGVKEELPEEENGKAVAGKAPQMADSSHCKLGLGFSSF